LLISVLTLSIVITGAQAPPPGPTPTSLSAAKIVKVKDNLYIITGSGADSFEAFSGGNTAVFVAERGVVLVDTKLPGWGQVILDRVKTVTTRPVVTIINTHAHSDHTGSNPFFGATVDSVVHENTRANMARMDDYKGDKAASLPKRTYKDKITIGAGKDAIDLYHFGPGHTNGDSFVVFRELRVMHVGDLFPWKALPYIDTENGGSVISHPKTLANAIANIKNVDTIINGHIPVSSWNDLREYADFSRDFVTWAEGVRKAGKTVDQGAAEYKVPTRYNGYKASANEDFGNAKTNLQAVYDELGKR
jgi:cyclase